MLVSKLNCWFLVTLKNFRFFESLSVLFGSSRMSHKVHLLDVCLLAFGWTGQRLSSRTSSSTLPLAFWVVCCTVKARRGFFWPIITGKMKHFCLCPRTGSQEREALGKGAELFSSPKAWARATPQVLVELGWMNSLDFLTNLCKKN